MRKSIVPVIGCFIFVFAILAFLSYHLGKMAEEVATLKETLNEKQKAEDAQNKAQAKQKEKEELEAKSVKDIAAVLNEVTKERNITSNNS